VNEMDTLREALYQADKLHDPRVIFDLLPEVEVFSQAEELLSNPDAGYLLGPTLIEAIQLRFDSLKERRRIFDVLLYALSHPSLDSLIYRYTQRAILFHSTKWQTIETRKFHSVFEDNYLQSQKQGDRYIAELSLEGCVWLPIYRQDEGLFLRAVSLLLTDFPELAENVGGNVDNLPVKAVKLLAHCYDFQPEYRSIRDKLLSLVKVNDQFILAEVHYSLGICSLYDAFKAVDAEGLKSALEQALKEFEGAEELEENRTDASLFGTITKCFLYLQNTPAGSTEAIEYVKTAQKLLFERLGAFPDDLPTTYSAAEIEIVKLISYFEHWISHTFAFDELEPQPSLQLLAKAYAAIRETEFRSKLPTLAKETGSRLVLLPYTSSQFVKSQEVLSKLQKILSSSSLRLTATSPELEFYDLAFKALRDVTDPKDSATTRVEEIRVVAERTCPELAQSIDKWKNRGYDGVDLFVNVIWEQMERDDLIDLQQQPVKDILKPLLAELNKILSPKYSHWSQLKLVLSFVTQYFLNVYNADATPDEKFLFKKPEGQGKEAKERDLQNHFYKVAQWQAQGIKCSSEVKNVAPGRPDLVLSSMGTDFPIEVKCEDNNLDRKHIRDSYLAQSQTYVTALVQVGFLFILDITPKQFGIPLKDKTDYCYIDRIEVPGEITPTCVCVFIFPGNRFSPSGHSWKK